MKTITTLATGSLAAAMILTVAACGNGAPTLTVNQGIADIQVVATGLQAALAQLAPSKLLSAAQLAAVQKDVADVQAVAANAAALTSGQSLSSADVKTFETAINDVVTLTTMPPVNALIPQPIEAGFVGAGILLPVIEAELNVTLPTAAKATLPVMTPAAARTALTKVVS